MSINQVFKQRCEKINECLYVNEACRKPLEYDPETMRAIPARRWIDCAGWKITLGMVFDKKSGSWVYPVTPEHFGYESVGKDVWREKKE